MRRLSLAMLGTCIMLFMASCKPEEEIVPMFERTIVYTVVEKTPDNSAAGSPTTVTVHLNDDNEWDALLDQLLGYAEEGKGVTFYNADRSMGESGEMATKLYRHDNNMPPKDSYTITTTSRSEMKAWCREMERRGLTVVIEYDSNSGTWSGTAYATAPRSADEECYTGILVKVGAHNMRDDSFLPGREWALQVNADTVLTLVRDGSFISANDYYINIEGREYGIGDTVTLCGSVSRAYEYNYQLFLVLVLDSSEVPYVAWATLPVYMGYVTFYYGEYPNSYTIDHVLTITIDETNHTLYCTSTFDDQLWQGKIGGGIFHYRPTGETDTAGDPILWVWPHSDTATGGFFTLTHSHEGWLGLRDWNNYPGDRVHTLGEIYLERQHPNSWETWVCDTTGLDIVFHLNNEACVVHSMGYSSSPFYVDCTTPFQIGEFTQSMSGGIGADGHEATYTATESRVYFYARYLDTRERNLLLTPYNSETSSCLGSYHFRRK